MSYKLTLKRIWGQGTTFQAGKQSKGRIIELEGMACLKKATYIECQSLMYLISLYFKKMHSSINTYFGQQDKNG